MRSTLAEVAQIDHRISQGLERVVQLTEAIESKQQAPELVFPAKHTLNGMEPLFENGGVEKRFPTSLGGFSTAGIRVGIWDHPAIENGFPVGSTIIGAIQAHNGSL